MSQEQSFKKKLALVFDEDLRTRPLKWNNWVDILIIVMIVLSTAAVFLGFPSSCFWWSTMPTPTWWATAGFPPFG